MDSSCLSSGVKPWSRADRQSATGDGEGSGSENPLIEDRALFVFCKLSVEFYEY